MLFKRKKNLSENQFVKKNLLAAYFEADFK